MRAVSGPSSRQQVVGHVREGVVVVAGLQQHQARASSVGRYAFSRQWALVQTNVVVRARALLAVTGQVVPGRLGHDAGRAAP